MDRVTAYDDDIFAWSREQAEELRRLATSARDLPNALDIGHIAEEIEDVGTSEVRRVESAIELWLIPLLKIASAPQARPVRHWRTEARIHHAGIVRHYRRSMRQDIDLDSIWMAAVGRADAALDEHGDALLPGLPATCPFTLDALVAPDFDPDRDLRWTTILARAGGAPAP